MSVVKFPARRRRRGAGAAAEEEVLRWAMTCPWASGAARAPHGGDLVVAAALFAADRNNLPELRIAANAFVARCLYPPYRLARLRAEAFDLARELTRRLGATGVRVAEATRRGETAPTSTPNATRPFRALRAGPPGRRSP